MAVADAPGSLDRSPANRRIVLLGASNLIRGLNSALNVCGQFFSGRLEYLIAAGHGRSYGVTSSFLRVRHLPSIQHCELWHELENRPRLPLSALISDIGNDLLYDYRPVEIAHWVEKCVENLCSHAADVVISEMPVTSLSKLGRRRFLFIRRVTYPRSSLTYENAMKRIDELHHRVLDLAKRYSVPTVRPESAWFGFDPIHIRFRYYPHAWQATFRRWNEAHWCRQPTVDSLFDWLRLQCLRPRKRSLFGRTQTRTQPSMVRKSGCSISLF